MTTDSRAPRTAAGRALLAKARTTDGWHTNFDAGDILAIEVEAHDQALGALLLTAGPGPGGVPLSVMSKENIDRALASVETRWRAEAAADPVAGEARPWRALIDDYGQEGERGGSMFITDDPDDSQRPIAQGLEWRQAKAIVDAHNAALPTPAPEEGEGDE